MTLKEKLETIKGKKIAIWCEEEYEAIELTEAMNKITGENNHDNYYDYSNDGTCYTLEAYNRYKQWGYSSRNHYIRENFKIITYKDFVEKLEIILTFIQNINKKRLIDRQMDNIEKAYESIPMGGKLEFSKSAIESIYQVLKELKRYKDLEEQGLLIKLPCKVGDVVWCITSDQYDYVVAPIECIVNEISANIDNPKLLLFRIDSNDSTDGWTDVFPNMRIPNHMNVRHIEDFGKTVFLTREEAELKLKEIR